MCHIMRLPPQKKVNGYVTVLTIFELGVTPLALLKTRHYLS